MTITMRQHRNGSVSIICFGVPNTFHTSFASALIKVATNRQWISDGQRVTATLMEEIVRLYDESIWKISNTIRKVEKVCIHPVFSEENTQRFCICQTMCYNQIS